MQRGLCSPFSRRPGPLFVRSPALQFGAARALSDWRVFGSTRTSAWTFGVGSVLAKRNLGLLGHGPDYINPKNWREKRDIREREFDPRKYWKKLVRDGGFQSTFNRYARWMAPRQYDRRNVLIHTVHWAVPIIVLLAVISFLLVPGYELLMWLANGLEVADLKRAILENYYEDTTSDSEDDFAADFETELEEEDFFKTYLFPSIIKICQPFILNHLPLIMELGDPIVIHPIHETINSEGYNWEIVQAVVGRERQALVAIRFRHMSHGWFYINGVTVDFLDGRTMFIKLPRRARWLDYVNYVDYKEAAYAAEHEEFFKRLERRDHNGELELQLESEFGDRSGDFSRVVEAIQKQERREDDDT